MSAGAWERQLSVIAVLVPEQAFAVLAPSDPFPLAVVNGQNTRLKVETMHPKIQTFKKP